MSAVAVIPIWKKWLTYRVNRNTGQPELIPSLTNATLILSHDSAYAGCLARDEFANVTKLVQPLPTVEGLKAPKVGPISDSHVVYCLNALNIINKVSIGFENCARAIDAAAEQCAFNPLVDALSDLRWDGESRLDTWLHRYLGAKDSNYTSAVGRWWLVSAIARALRPGCQADHILVLEGKQGAAKSSAVRILGGEFTLSKLPSLRDYDRAAHALTGRWIVEIGELDAFRGAASSQIKDFLSLQVDHYHAPYGRYHVTRGRTCVFIGTTNEYQYLQDPTGARRFWPVKIGYIHRAELVRDRDQILAEAFEAFRSGTEFADIDRPPRTRWWPGPDLETELIEEQESRQEMDAWEPIVAKWLNTPLVDGSRSIARDGLSTADILLGALDFKMDRCDRESQSRVGKILRKMEWNPIQKREHGLRVRRYWRPTEPE